MVRPTPPILPGVPLLGSLPEFYRDRHGLLRRGFDTLGPIFGLRLGPKRAAVLVGPEYSARFFQQTDTTLSMDRAYRFIVPMFGEPVGFVGGPEVYRLQRPIYGEFFKASKMAGYLQVMGEEVHAWLAGLGDAGELELVSCLEALTRHVAAHAFLGGDFRFRMGEAFWSLFHDLVAGIDPVLPARLPLPRFVRRAGCWRNLHRSEGSQASW